MAIAYNNKGFKFRGPLNSWIQSRILLDLLLDIQTLLTNLGKQFAILNGQQPLASLLCNLIKEYNDRINPMLMLIMSRC